MEIGIPFQTAQADLGLCRHLEGCGAGVEIANAFRSVRQVTQQGTDRQSMDETQSIMTGGLEHDRLGVVTPYRLIVVAPFGHGFKFPMPPGSGRRER